MWMQNELTFDFPFILILVIGSVSFIFTNIILDRTSKITKKIASIIVFSLVFLCSIFYSLNKKEKLEVLIGKGELVRVLGYVTGFKVHNSLKSFKVSDQKFWIESFSLYCVNDISRVKNGAFLRILYVDIPGNFLAAESRCILQLEEVENKSQ